MRTEETRQRMITETIVTWTCDNCGYKTTRNSGMCGTSPIMECSCCEGHACRKCRHAYEKDEGGDCFYGLMVCEKCNPLFEAAWSLAKDLTKWDQCLEEEAMTIFKQMKE